MKQAEKNGNETADVFGFCKYKNKTGFVRVIARKLSQEQKEKSQKRRKKKAVKSQKRITECQAFQCECYLRENRKDTGSIYENLTKVQHHVILKHNILLYNEEDKNVIQQISDAELEIMKIVWGNPQEMTLFSYIMDGLAARGKPCQKNTLIVLLSRLMNKGFLSARKIGRRNEYTVLVSETEYQTAQTKNFLDKIYEGSAKGLVSNLILGDLLTDEEYEELKMLLEKGKENQ